MAVIWNTSCKKCILWARDIKSMVFLFVNISASRTCNIFFGGGVLVLVLNHYQWVASILRQFWIILSPNKQWRKIFFLSNPKYSDRELIVVIVYNFQTWNKKEHIIISWVNSSHMGPMYTETPYIIMYIETPYMTMYTKTPYALAVTWVPCILRHPILELHIISFPCMYANVHISFR